MEHVAIMSKLTQLTDEEKLAIKTSFPIVKPLKRNLFT